MPRRPLSGWLLAILLISTSLVTTAAPAAAQPDVVPFTGCNEPHAAVVSPVNPQNVVVAECNSVAVSTDFGRTFTIGFQNTTTLPAGLAAGNWGNCGDPALTFDAQGRLFWTYLLCGDYAPADGNRDEMTIVVAQINPTNGALIGNPVDTTPGTFTDDKQWLVADARPSSPYANNLYMVWSRLDSNQVMFVRSTNQGVTWSAPQAVSAGTDPGFLWPSHIAVGPNGDVYVGYHSDTCGAATARTFILRDSSGGADLVAGTAVQKSSFAAATTCNVQDTGPAIPNTDFWMQGDQQPWILPDPLRPGNVYVVANDDPNDDFNTGDATNVILARSTNYGNTWSISTISHSPAGTVEVMPTAAIDQDGKIAVFWYDSRREIMNNNGTPANAADDYFNLDVFGTTSRDGGLSFVNDFRINDAQFDPNLGAPCRWQCNAGDPGPRTLRIGEYNGIAAANGNAYAAWTGNSGGGQGMFFDVFSLDGAFGDRFEPNDSPQPGVPTDLGAHGAYNQPELTLHNELDEDVFRVTALNTGRLTAELSQNARLADADIQVRDRFNQVVATASTAADGNALERLTWPAVAGQSYLVRVFGQAGQFPAQTVYDLNIVNTTAPVPFGIGLEPGSDSGWYDDDDITSDTTPDVTLLVDQDPLDGIAMSPTPNATLTDDAPGYKVGVYVNGTLDGFATPAAGTGLYRYTLSGSSVVQGVNAITGRVLIVDPSDDPATAGTSHVVGRGASSAAFLLTVDDVAPAPPSPPDLLDSSDSGPSNSDNITGISSPAFQGTAEPNTRVRVLANGVNIGEGVVGSDGTDGVTGNGLGAWEVTVEPLVDGSYTITAVVEDRAGNISAPSAPMAGGPLVIDTPGNGTPQRPTMQLRAEDDTGRASNDNVTRLSTLRFIVSGEVGTTMVIKNGNTVIDTWVQAAPFDERVLVLAEGRHPLSAESTDAAGNRSAQSEELRLAVDTTPPTTPAAPDLLATADTGGIADDDVTTLRQAQFGGTGEPNALSRLFVDGALIGEAALNASGAYQTTSALLADGVGLFAVQYEDLAGNLSPVSPPLKVTIAHESLRLPGATASGPAGALVLDLGAGTIDGYPGIAGATGKIGIVGIPAVTFAGNGQSLSVLGSTGSDDITYTPASISGGSLTRAGTSQVLSFTEVGTLAVDPLAGDDVVTLVGTAGADSVDVVVDVITTAQANGTLLASMPSATVERVGTRTLAGADTITVAARDTVSEFVSVDAGDPATAPKKPGDLLTVVSLSPRSALQNSPGGPTPGSGVATVSYPRTTGHTTRVDYSYVERTVLTRA